MSNDPLTTLDTNLKEILETLTLRHGIEYATKVSAMFALTEQIDELERIACTCSAMIADAHPINEQRSIAEQKHTACHLLADNIKTSIEDTMEYYCTLPGYENFIRDVQLLRDRAQVDYHNKIGH